MFCWDIVSKLIPLSLTFITEPIAQPVENRSPLIQSPAWPTFFPRTDDSHCDRVHFFLTPLCCFDNGYVGKQPVAGKKNSSKAWIGALADTIKLK